MGNRLTINMRIDSAEDVAEIRKKFTEATYLAENSFSFDPELICQ